ncbi:MAG: hypothetical protein MZW92_50185 [Comamonadaceae bacterium]|nr:hypothetical protein [Comamonadaceae bacterium]
MLLLALLIAAFFAFDLGQYFSLAFFKSQQAAIDAYYAAHPLQTIADLLRDLRRRHRPVAARRGDHDAGGRRHVRPAGGHASSSPSPRPSARTLAFLVSRFLLRDWVQARFGDKLEGGQRRHGEGRRASTCSPCAWCRCSRSSSSTW